MRLIDADELIPLIKMGEMNTYIELGEGRNGGIAFAIERINQMPTIEERKKGKWEVEHGMMMHDNIYGDIYRCSECGHWERDVDGHNFCFNCGADMRGEEHGHDQQTGSDSMGKN